MLYLPERTDMMQCCLLKALMCENGYKKGEHGRLIVI